MYIQTMNTVWYCLTMYVVVIHLDNAYSTHMAACVVPGLLLQKPGMTPSFFSLLQVVLCCLRWHLPQLQLDGLAPQSLASGSKGEISWCVCGCWCVWAGLPWRWGLQYHWGQCLVHGFTSIENSLQYTFTACAFIVLFAFHASLSRWLCVRLYDLFHPLLNMNLIRSSSVFQIYCVW